MSQTQYDAKVKFFDVMNDCSVERKPDIPEEKSSLCTTRRFGSKFCYQKTSTEASDVLIFKNLI